MPDFVFLDLSVSSGSRHWNSKIIFGYLVELFVVRFKLEQFRRFLATKVGFMVSLRCCNSVALTPSSSHIPFRNARCRIRKAQLFIFLIDLVYTVDELALLVCRYTKQRAEKRLLCQQCMGARPHQHGRGDLRSTPNRIYGFVRFTLFANRK